MLTGRKLQTSPKRGQLLLNIFSPLEHATVAKYKVTRNIVFLQRLGAFNHIPSFVYW